MDLLDISLWLLEFTPYDDNGLKFAFASNILLCVEQKR
jgi:hypothetical protein